VSGNRWASQPRRRREPVAGPATPLGVEEMVGERLSVLGREAERTELAGNVGQERTGKDFTKPTPCSRRVSAIASAPAEIATAAGVSGFAITSGSPASPASRRLGSSGIDPSSGAHRAPPGPSPPPPPQH